MSGMHKKTPRRTGALVALVFVGQRIAVLSRLFADPSRFGFSIYDGFGNLSELFVGVPFLVQRFLQQVRNIRVPELLSERASASIGRDLIMLDALGGADESPRLAREAPVPLPSFSHPLRSIRPSLCTSRRGRTRCRVA